VAGGGIGGIGGIAIGTVAAGSVLIWSGLKGASVLSVVQSLVQGKKPAVPDPAPNAITTPVDTASPTSATNAETGAPGGTQVSMGNITVAAWFGPLIDYAVAHGWTGTLTSGYRSEADQARVCSTGVQPCATPGTSHHQGISYPDGAIDVTPRYSGPVAFCNAVRNSGLQGATEIQPAGSKDPVHISIPGSHRSGEGTY
jgi:hypothetical protein